MDVEMSELSVKGIMILENPALLYVRAGEKKEGVTTCNS